MLSLDVESLCTSVPRGETIDIYVLKNHLRPVKQFQALTSNKV